MNIGWLLLILFICLLAIAGIGVWFSVWLEERYRKEDLEMQALHSEAVSIPDKLEPR